MDFENLMTKVKSNWAALLLIATLLTVGVQFGGMFFAFNAQVQSLTTQITQIVKNSDLVVVLEAEVQELEMKVTNLQIQSNNHLFDGANSVLNIIDVKRILDEQPISRTILKQACASSEIKLKLIASHDADKVNEFCNYVTK